MEKSTPFCQKKKERNENMKKKEWKKAAACALSVTMIGLQSVPAYAEESTQEVTSEATVPAESADETDGQNTEVNTSETDVAKTPITTEQADTTDETTGDGTESGEEKTTEAVAKIGDQEYESLTDAAAALQNGETLTLLQDYSGTTTIQTKAQGITIDLNGHSITNTSTSTTAIAVKLYYNPYGKAQEEMGTIVKPSKIINSQETAATITGAVPVNVTGQNCSMEGQIGENVTLTASNSRSPKVVLSKGGFLENTATNQAYVRNSWIVAHEDKSCLYAISEVNYAGNYAYDAEDADSATIKLQTTYSGTDQIKYTGNKKNLTIDLNNKQYTCSSTSKAAFAIAYPNKNITLKNGKITASKYNAIEVQESNSSLTLDGVAVTAGTLPSATQKYGIVTIGSEENDTIVLKNRSTVTSKYGYGIYFPSSGSLTIEDSTITAKYVGVQICAGDLTVTNSTIKATNAPVAKTEDDGVISDGSAISIVNRAGYKGIGTVKIESGTFTSKSGTTATAIRAYTFNNTTKQEEAWKEAGDKVTITGGKFVNGIPDNMAELCGASKDVVLTASGTYEVKDATDTYQAEITTAEGNVIKAASFTTAVYNAPAGSTVKLIKGDDDSTLNIGGVTASISKSITIDLNGYTLTGTAVNGTMSINPSSSSSCEVVVKNGKIVNTNASNQYYAVLVRNDANVRFEDVQIESENAKALNIGATSDSHQPTVTINGNSSMTGGVCGIGLTPKAGSSTAKLIVNSGTISGGDYGIAGNGSCDGTDIVINGGIIKATGTEGTAVYYPQDGNLTITGGKIEGAQGVQFAGSGKISVTGGTLKATNTNPADSHDKDGDGSIADGAALSIVSRSGYGAAGSTEVEITGGTFESAAATAIQEYGSGDVTETLVKSMTVGGDTLKVTSPEGTSAINFELLEGEAAKVVSGGSFSSRVDEKYCADTTSSGDTGTSYTPVEIKDEDGNISYGVDDSVSVDFKGGSLRMDKTLADGTADTSETSLRFGYQINVKNDASIAEWGWKYGVVEATADKLPLSAKGKNQIKNNEGFVSNLVVTAITPKNYTDKIYEAVYVTYRKDSKTYTVTGSVEDRSVQDVVNAILNSSTATKEEKAYANALNEVIDNKNWTSYY